MQCDFNGLDIHQALWAKCDNVYLPPFVFNELLTYLCDIHRGEKKEIEMLKDEIKTQEQFEKGFAEFKKKYPEYKDAKPIERLNLIMRKEFAMQILKGEKKMEFRAFSEYYCNRLVDKDINNFMNKYFGTEHEDEVFFYANYVRPVKIIHFHNYSNSWHLDVECERNDFVTLTDGDVKFLNEEYGCHELDDMLNDFNKRKEENRPLFFYFSCGKVIDTNLQL